MRILQLTVHFSPNVGGVETHLDDLVKGLIEKSNQVFVLTYKPLTAKASAQVWEKRKNLNIFRIPWIAGFFYKFVKNPLIEFLYLFPGLFISLPFVVLFFRPKVIHTHGLIAGFVGVFWGKVFGIRTITTTHSLYHFPSRGLYHGFVKWIFGNSDKILTLSRLSKKEIVSLGIPENEVQVFTYWVDLEKFSKVKDANKKLGWDKKFVVLYVGRLVEEKGALVLLESLKSWHKDIYLAIAGTGPLETKIEREAQKNGHLIFLRKIDNDKLALYYSAADLTIVPSIHDEGFGRIILESLACGTPVIGSNRGAIPEAMDESVGRLIKITPNNINRTVNSLYKDSKELKQLGSKAAKFAAQKYGSQNIETIINTYV